MDDAAVSQALDRAMQLLRSGKLEQSGLIYKKILEHHPNHPEALHWFGAIAYQMGEMAVAIANVEKALVQRPEDPAILNTSGLICHAIGTWDQALKYYYQALQIKPGSPEVMGNLQALVRDLLPAYAQYAQWHYLAGSFDRVAELELVSGNLLREIGDLAGAELHYRRGLAVRPVMWGVTAPEAIVQADRTGQPVPPPAAQTTCEPGREADLRLMASAPSFAQLMERLAAIHFDRATIESSEADQAIALDLITEALAIQPAFPEALKLYGNLLLAKGDHQGAAETYQKAVQFNPNYAEAWCNLGSLLMGKRQTDEAVQCFQRAIQANPKMAQAYWSMGCAFANVNKGPEAIQCWQQAIAIDPKVQGVQGYYRIAQGLMQLGERPVAFEWFERAIQFDRKFIDAHWDLLEHLMFWGVLPQAKLAAERCWATFNEPGTSKRDRVLAGVITTKTFCFIGLGHIARQLFLEIEPDFYHVIDELSPFDVTKLYGNVLFDMPHLRDDVAANARMANVLADGYRKIIESNIAEHQAVGSKVYAAPETRSPRTSDRLRIGFMSRHYRRHSVGWCSGEILTALKEHTPHLFMYVTGDLTKDDRTPVFESAAEKFYWPGKDDFPDATAPSILRRAREDNLDVLIDLDSITILPHAEVLHQRPAPVCITWLGYDAPHICPDNYNLVDWNTHPAGVEHYYVEKLVRMSGSFAALSYLPSVVTDRVKQRQAFRIAADQTIFLSVPTGQKVSLEMLQAQVNVLRHTPDSILFFKSRVGDLDVMLAMYHEECRRQGVNPNRVRMLPRTASEEEHRAVYQIADVLLDSYPYSGATHNLEALYFNQPVVTRVGEQSFSRLGYSLMRAAGLDNEGMSWTWDEYIDWGVRLGRDRNLCDAVRDKLKRAKDPANPAPLWNPKGFAAEMYGILQDLRSKAEFSNSK